MFVFYAVERLILGSTEREIWTTRYFLPPWQDFFDLFNSIPLALIGMLIAWRIRHTAALIFFASMLLHIAFDFPLHHDDGHRHFWPLSDWRFASPVSYWDVNHFGVYASTAELGLFVGCYLLAIWRHQRRCIRVAVSILAVVHLGFMTFAITHWGGMN